MKVNQILLSKFIANDDSSPLFASSNGIHGAFHIERLDITIAVTDKELEAIEFLQTYKLERINNVSNSKYKDISQEKLTTYQQIFNEFWQAHNHEVAHFYQVLALPAFQMVWTTKYNSLKFHATTMLLNFDEDGYYILGEHQTLIDILKTLNVTEEMIESHDTIANNYLKYCAKFKTPIKEGVSLFHIIEGMAHVMSLQLMDEPNLDSLELSSEETYNKAFKQFQKSLSNTDLELRWQYLLFIYLCYFSCQSVSVSTSDVDKLNPVNVFFKLCEYIDDIASLISHKFNLFLPMSPSELQSYYFEEWQLSNDALQHASHAQRASIYAFFNAIMAFEKLFFECVEDIVKVEIEEIEPLVQLSKAYGVDWTNKYTLARMLIFPSNYSWVREVYDDYKKSNSKDKTFTNQQNAEFYEFIQSCRNILNERYEVYCCDDHSFRENRKQILKCSNPDSFANKLKHLTNKQPEQLFR